MSLNQYDLMINDNKIPFLEKVKESNYAGKALCPKDIMSVLVDNFSINRLAEEHVYVLGCTSDGVINSVFDVSHGRVDSSIASPREIFIRLLLGGAVYFIIAHNHPSGSIKPSEADTKMCQKLKQAAELMQIPMKDFLIIGNYCYYSYQENNMM